MDMNFVCDRYNWRQTRMIKNILGDRRIEMGAPIACDGLGSIVDTSASITNAILNRPTLTIVNTPYRQWHLSRTSRLHTIAKEYEGSLRECALPVMYVDIYNGLAEISLAFENMFPNIPPIAMNLICSYNQRCPCEFMDSGFVQKFKRISDQNCMFISDEDVIRTARKLLSCKCW